jgi:hypothetical protein
VSVDQSSQSPNSPNPKSSSPPIAASRSPAARFSARDAAQIRSTNTAAAARDFTSIELISIMAEGNDIRPDAIGVRRDPGEARRHGHTVDVACDEAVVEQPGDRFVERR